MASRFASRFTCPYAFIVISSVVCPTISIAVRGGTPSSSKIDTQPCQKSCNRTTLTPAALHAFCTIRVQFRGSIGVPTTEVNT